jgi:hypothetical protein
VAKTFRGVGVAMGVVLDVFTKLSPVIERVGKLLEPIGGFMRVQRPSGLGQLGAIGNLIVSARSGDVAGGISRAGAAVGDAVGTARANVSNFTINVMADPRATATELADQIEGKLRDFRERQAQTFSERILRGL